MTGDEEELRARLGEIASRHRPSVPEGDWLRRRLRRSRAHRLAAIAGGTALAVAAALTLPGLRDVDGDSDPVDVIAASDSASPTPSAAPPPLTERTSARLLVIQGNDNRVVELDVDAGSTRTVPTNGDLGYPSQVQAVVVAGQLVMVGYVDTGAGHGASTVYATTDGPGSPMKVIGDGGNLHASVHSDRVWLSTVLDTDNGSTTLEEVDLSGRTHATVTFPGARDTSPYGPDFLRYAADGSELEVVTDEGRVVGSFGSSRALAQTADTIAVWGDNGDEGCGINVMLAEGTDGDRAQVPRADCPRTPAAFSADHTSLYFGTGDVVGAAPMRRLDVFAHETSDIGITAAVLDGPSIVVSSDNKWAFFVGADRNHIDAYDVESGQAFRVAAEFDAITQLLVE